MSDLDQVIPLLTRGFAQNREHWVWVMDGLTARPKVPGYPRYGYVLDHGGDLVGVILLIFTSVTKSGQTRVRCSVSSWYVDPSFRLYGSMLAYRAVKAKNVAYFNVTPAEHTWKILEAHGFRRFAEGRTVAAPILSRCRTAARVHAVSPNSPVPIAAGEDLEQGEIKLLLDHAGFGCMSLICETPDGRHPFVFGRDRRYGFLPVAHLVYCRSVEDFVRLAKPVGKYLARLGFGFVMLESNGPVKGLVGRHAGGRPRFTKGPDEIRPGDVAYSEQVMFGYY
jgi:hypothetical protein